MTDTLTLIQQANAILAAFPEEEREEEPTREEQEAAWFHNQAALLGAFGEVNQDEEDARRALVGEMSGNPDGPGGAVGESVPGTVNGQNTRYSCPNVRQELQVRYQANPNANGDDGLSLGDYFVRPADEEDAWTLVLVGRSDLDGTRATASRVNANVQGKRRGRRPSCLCGSCQKCKARARKQAERERNDELGAQRAEAAERASKLGNVVAEAADRGW